MTAADPADIAGEPRFRALYQDNYRPVLVYVTNRLGPSDEVADIVAEVFTTAWRRLADVPAPPAERHWLFGTARRVISRRRRGAARHSNLMRRLSAQRGGDYEPFGRADPARERLLTAISQLKKADREALMLVHWDGLSYAEAGAAMGCSANAIGIRAHRAKARLRELLGMGPPTPSRQYLVPFAPEPCPPARAGTTELEGSH
jgi:RNA polymerase sigma-70 factor (ECF subfamily)